MNTNQRLEGTRLFLKLAEKNPIFKNEGEKLTNMEIVLFFHLLSISRYNNTADYNLVIDSKTKSFIYQRLHMSTESLKKSISSLAKHNIIFKIKKEHYLINPEIAGKGTDADLITSAIKCGKVTAPLTSDCVRLFKNPWAVLEIFANTSKSLTFNYIYFCLFLKLLDIMEYCGPNKEYGGNTITLKKEDRQNLITELNITKKNLEKALLFFQNSGLMLKIKNGTYQINPYIIAKGTDEDVLFIREFSQFRDKGWGKRTATQLMASLSKFIQSKTEETITQEKKEYMIAAVKTNYKALKVYEEYREELEREEELQNQKLVLRSRFFNKNTQMA